MAYLSGPVLQLQDWEHLLMLLLGANLLSTKLKILFVTMVFSTNELKTGF